MGERADNRGQDSVPAARAKTPPDLQAVTDKPAPAPKSAGRPMSPEFLSLTYTLPCHLVTQVDDIAANTNRSPSEVIAESVRLYVKACAARQERTRISTFEGFSYQEVAVADAAIEDPPSVPAEPPTQRAADGPPPGRRQTESRSRRPDLELPPDEDAEKERQTAASEVPEPAADTGETDSASGDGEHAVPDDGSDQALREIADPAADVRRRLEEVADQPLHSTRVRHVLEQIMRDVDCKDFSPAEHSVKVAEMARGLAEAKGFRGNRLLEVHIAGLVHDIGKACIPDEILKKQKPSPEEMALIRKYPEFGADLLQAIPAMEPVIPLVGAHQERWNGSGYPGKLHGNDIPFAAQIVALCDVYDVLVTDRRYRPAYTEDRARQIIKQNVGALWNPEIARIFLSQIVGDDRGARMAAGR